MVSYMHHSHTLAQVLKLIQFRRVGILRSECGGTRWGTGGEVNGKLANEVGSQYSHTTSGRSVSSITNAVAHTSAASSRLNWLPRRFKWTRPFRRKTKTGFCACAIRFRTSSISRLNQRSLRSCSSMFWVTNFKLFSLLRIFNKINEENSKSKAHCF